MPYFVKLHRRCVRHVFGLGVIKHFHNRIHPTVYNYCLISGYANQCRPADGRFNVVSLHANILTNKKGPARTFFVEMEFSSRESPLWHVLTIP